MRLTRTIVRRRWPLIEDFRCKTIIFCSLVKFAIHETSCSFPACSGDRISCASVWGACITLSENSRHHHHAPQRSGWPRDGGRECGTHRILSGQVLGSRPSSAFSTQNQIQRRPFLVSRRFIMAGPSSEWYRIVIGSRISELLFESAGLASPAPGSTALSCMKFGSLHFT
jgi:hypothetical protein